MINPSDAILVSMRAANRAGSDEESQPSQPTAPSGSAAVGNLTGVKNVAPDEPGMLGTIADYGLSTLGAVGNFLDVPGSMVRDVMTWVPGGIEAQNPFDQLLSPLSSENRVTGEDMLKSAGIAGDDTWGGFLGGLALEIGLDPLTYMTFGASAATKAGKAAQKAGLYKNAKRVANKRAGKELGKDAGRKLGASSSRQTVTPRMLIDDAADLDDLAIETARQDAARPYRVKMKDEESLLRKQADEMGWDENQLENKLEEVRSRWSKQADEAAESALKSAPEKARAEAMRKFKLAGGTDEMLDEKLGGLVRFSIPFISNSKLAKKYPILRERVYGTLDMAPEELAKQPWFEKFMGGIRGGKPAKAAGDIDTPRGGPDTPGGGPDMPDGGPSGSPQGPGDAPTGGQATTPEAPVDAATSTQRSADTVDSSQVAGGDIADDVPVREAAEEFKAPTRDEFIQISRQHKRFQAAMDRMSKMKILDEADQEIMRTIFSKSNLGSFERVFFRAVDKMEIPDAQARSVAESMGILPEELPDVAGATWRDGEGAIRGQVSKKGTKAGTGTTGLETMVHELGHAFLFASDDIAKEVKLDITKEFDALLKDGTLTKYFNDNYGVEKARYYTSNPHEAFAQYFADSVFQRHGLNQPAKAQTLMQKVRDYVKQSLDRILRRGGLSPQAKEKLDAMADVVGGFMTPEEFNALYGDVAKGSKAAEAAKAARTASKADPEQAVKQAAKVFGVDEAVDEAAETAAKAVDETEEFVFNAAETGEDITNDIEAIVGPGMTREMMEMVYDDILPEQREELADYFRMTNPELTDDIADIFDQAGEAAGDVADDVPASAADEAVEAVEEVADDAVEETPKPRVNEPAYKAFVDDPDQLMSEIEKTSFDTYDEATAAAELGTYRARMLGEEYASVVGRALSPKKFIEGPKDFIESALKPSDARTGTPLGDNILLHPSKEEAELQASKFLSMLPRYLRKKDAINIQLVKSKKHGDRYRVKLSNLNKNLLLHASEDEAMEQAAEFFSMLPDHMKVDGIIEVKPLARGKNRGKFEVRIANKYFVDFVDMRKVQADLVADMVNPSVKAFGRSMTNEELLKAMKERAGTQTYGTEKAARTAAEELNASLPLDVRTGVTYVAIETRDKLGRELELAAEELQDLTAQQQQLARLLDGATGEVEAELSKQLNQVKDLIARRQAGQARIASELEKIVGSPFEVIPNEITDYSPRIDEIADTANEQSKRSARLAEIESIYDQRDPLGDVRNAGASDFDPTAMQARLGEQAVSDFNDWLMRSADNAAPPSPLAEAAAPQIPDAPKMSGGLRDEISDTVEATMREDGLSEAEATTLAIKGLADDTAGPGPRYHGQFDGVKKGDPEYKQLQKWQRIRREAKRLAKEMGEDAAPSPTVANVAEEAVQPAKDTEVSFAKRGTQSGKSIIEAAGSDGSRFRLEGRSGLWTIFRKGDWKAKGKQAKRSNSKIAEQLSLRDAKDVVKRLASGEITAESGAKFGKIRSPKPISDAELKEMFTNPRTFYRALETLRQDGMAATASFVFKPSKKIRDMLLKEGEFISSPNKLSVEEVIQSSIEGMVPGKPVAQRGIAGSQSDALLLVAGKEGGAAKAVEVRKKYHDLIMKSNKGADVFVSPNDAVVYKIGDEVVGVLKGVDSNDKLMKSNFKEAVRRFDNQEPLYNFGDPPEVASSRQTKTPEFKKWFAGSKVVDDSGEPLVVYHGTKDASLGSDAAKNYNAKLGDAQRRQVEWDSKHRAKREALLQEASSASKRIDELAQSISRSDAYNVRYGLYEAKNYNDFVGTLTDSQRQLGDERLRAIYDEAKELVAKENKSRSELAKIPSRPRFSGASPSDVGRLDESVFFDTMRYGANDPGYLSAGSYFTNSAKLASDYAGRASGSGVLPVYLSIKNPFIHGVTKQPGLEKRINEIIDSKYASLGQSGDPDAFLRANAEARREALIEFGYDGEIYDSARAKRGGAARSDMADSEIVAFYPEQVKSATGNRGTFDAANPDIRYNFGEPPEVSVSRQTQTPEFKKWFAGSKIKSSDGKPMRLFHGSLSAFNRFAPQNTNSMYGRGVYLTSSADDAAQYATSNTSNPDALMNPDLISKAESMVSELGIPYAEAKQALAPTGGAMYPVFASIKNPLEIVDKPVVFDEKAMRLAVAEADARVDDVGALVAKLNQADSALKQHDILLRNNATQALGPYASIKNHDGVVIGEGIAPRSGGARHVIAFRPEQVKSATGNSGAFDAANPDIRYNFGEPVEPFYSKAKRFVENAKQPIATSEQWLATMRKAGVKAEEIEDLGLDELLKPGAKVSRDELQQRIDEVGTHAFFEEELGDDYIDFTVPGGVEGSYKVNTLKVVADGELLSNPGGSKHFGSEAIAHMRSDDVALPSGGKALRIQEIQSDWHQFGKKKGYRKDSRIDTSKWTAKALGEDEVRDLGIFGGEFDFLRRIRNVYAVHDENGKYVHTFTSSSPENAIELAAEQVVGSAATDAPFKKSWPLLTAKHAVSLAVEGGYEEIRIVDGRDIAEAVGGPPDKLADFYNKVLSGSISKYLKKFGVKKETQTRVVGTKAQWEKSGDLANTWVVKSEYIEGLVNIAGKTADGQDVYLAALDGSSLREADDSLRVFRSLDEAKEAVAREAAANGMEGFGQYKLTETVFKLNDKIREVVRSEGQPLYNFGEPPEGPGRMDQAKDLAGNAMDYMRDKMSGMASMGEDGLGAIPGRVKDTLQGDQFKAKAGVAMDTLGGIVKHSGPFRLLRANLDPRTMGAVNELGQSVGEQRYEGLQEARMLARKRLAPVAQQFLRKPELNVEEMAKRLGSQEKAQAAVVANYNAITRYLEDATALMDEGKPKPLLPDELMDLKPALDEMKVALDEIREIELQSGIKSATLNDTFISYLPRQLYRFPGDKSGKGNLGKVLEPGSRYQVQRREFLKDIPGGTETLNQMSVDTKISGIKHAMEGKELTKEQFDEARKYILETYGGGSVMNRRYDKIWALPDEQFDALVDFITGLDPRHAQFQVPLYKLDPVQNVINRMEAGYAAAAAGDFSSALFAAGAIKKGEQPGTVTLAKALSGWSVNGMDKDILKMRVVEKMGDTFVAEKGAMQQARDVAARERIEREIGGVSPATLAAGYGPNAKIRVSVNGVDGYVESLHSGNKASVKLNDIEEPVEVPVSEIGGTIVSDDDVLKQFTVEERTAESLTRYMKGFTSPEQAGMFAEALESVTNLYKANLTIPWPAFHVRNFISGMYNNLILGATDPRFKGPRGIVKALGKTVTDADKLMRGQVIDDVLEIPMIKEMGITDKEQAMDVLRQEIYANNLVDADQGWGMDVVGEDLGDARSQMVGLSPQTLRQVMSPPPRPAGATRWDAAKPWKGAGIGSNEQDVFLPYRWGRKVGNYVEGINRTAPFIAYLRQGVDPAEAARRVFEAQFDYSKQTPSDRVMRRIFPFWSYTKNIVPFTVMNLTREPGGLVAQTIRSTSNARTDKPVPSWIASQASIPFGSRANIDKGDASFITGLGLGFEDPLSMAGFLAGDPEDTFRNVISRSNPLLKAPLELAFGESSYFDGPGGGRALKDMDPTYGRIMSNVRSLVTGEEGPPRAEPLLGSPLAEHVLSNLPTARVGNTLRTMTDTRKIKNPLKMALNLGTGVKVTDVSEAAWDADLQNRLMEMMKDMGARDFVRTYFPDYIKDRMDEDELRKLEGIEDLMAWLSDRAKSRAEEREMAATTE